MDIAEYLERFEMIMHGQCLEGVVFRHGTRQERLGYLPKGYRCGKQGLCFMNAYQTASTYGLQYVEGFAIRDCFPLPTHHAWVMMDGKAVDVTWKEQGTSYYGIPLDMEYIHKVFVETKVYGVLNPDSPTFLARFAGRPNSRADFCLSE